MARVHDDKDPGSENPDIGYLRFRKGGVINPKTPERKNDRGRPIYKPYLRNNPISINLKKDSIVKKDEYNLTEMWLVRSEPEDPVAKIYVAEIIEPVEEI